MTQQVLTALGGLGLFLLGMLVMTEGLHRLAGPAMHQWLVRFTRSPSTGALTGTLATAVLQSSSATTVTTVGMVAAGLLTFPQALGIIFGANLGTTVTGWMVALLGFKLKIGAAALPVVFVGAMLRVFGRQQWSHAGAVMAGFGVIFLGIGFMQTGVGEISDWLDPGQLPSEGLGGRLALVGLGTLVVLVTRSSSAGVAMAMTALSSGAIGFSQAACMVIGMDVGTTVTAVLAALGSSDAARRTGFSHTIYNVFTAVGALLILDFYVRLLEYAWPGAAATSPSIALVGFHTLFNFMALAIGIPLAGQFARFMAWLVPPRDRHLTRRLDERLLAEPAAAAAAMSATLRDVYRYLLQWMVQALSGSGPEPRPGQQDVERDLHDIRDYLDRMNVVPGEGQRQMAVVTAMHVLDHLRRMHWRLGQSDRVATVRGVTELQAVRRELVEAARQALAELDEGLGRETCTASGRLAFTLLESAEADREQAIARAVDQDLSVGETNQLLAARRWLQRMAHHLWRINTHLGGYERPDTAPD